jgi:hypothetical protein
MEFGVCHTDPVYKYKYKAYFLLRVTRSRSPELVFYRFSNHAPSMNIKIPILFCLPGLLDPKFVGSTTFRNVGKYYQTITASHSRRTEASVSETFYSGIDT